MQPYAPLGTLYAASALRRNGVHVAIFDSMLQEPSAGFETALKQHRPKIVAVYEDDFNFLSKMCLTRMREVACDIAAHARAAGAIVIAHGSDASDNSRLFLKSGFDYVLCGEAEETLVRLCSGLLAGAPIPEMEGLVSRRNLLKTVPSRSRNPGWAQLPAPSRDLIDLEPYREAWTAAHGYFSVNMVTSRGCPFHCNWCAKPISGNKFQLRHPSAVAEEMRALKSKAGAQHIWFGDDVFALSGKWVHEFAHEVVKRGAVLPFKIQSRADLMSENTVEALKMAGCAEVWMGVESGSQAVLDAMDKGLDLKAVVAARARLGEAGIRACYFLQFGYPGEQWPQLQQTIELVRDTRPDDIGVSFSYPLPGTVFYNRTQAELGTKRNWTDSDDLCIMFHAAYTTEFYRAVRDALHAEVDSWHSKSNSTEPVSDVARLWRTVEQLEPACRNRHALRVNNRHSRRASLDSIVPVEEIMMAREA
jgi:radical SAM superfamily enzyme YgiQ (UPF0313 family)